MLLPLPQPSHCLTCHQELLPGPNRPERFCSNKCMMFYHGPSGQPFPLVDEPTPLEMYLLKLKEKTARVGADLQASMAMRELTGTPWNEDDLAGLRWLAEGDPIAQAIVKNQPLPPHILQAINDGREIPPGTKLD